MLYIIISALMHARAVEVKCKAIALYVVPRTLIIKHGIPKVRIRIQTQTPQSLLLHLKQMQLVFIIISAVQDAKAEQVRRAYVPHVAENWCITRHITNKRINA